jgi:hypothetical protein
VALPVFKTGLAGIAFAGRFDSFPPPPTFILISFGLSRRCQQSANRSTKVVRHLAHR